MTPPLDAPMASLSAVTGFDLGAIPNQSQVTSQQAVDNCSIPRLPLVFGVHGTSHVVSTGSDPQVEHPQVPIQKNNPHSSQQEKAPSSVGAFSHCLACDRVGNLPKKRRTALDLETAGLIFGGAAILFLIVSAARRRR